MAKKGYALDEEMFERLKRQMRAQPGVQAAAFSTHRRSRWPVGGGSSCAARNEIWDVNIGGSPTAGTFKLSVGIPDSDGLITTTELTFNHDDDSTEATTVLETHANIASGDVTVTGGPWPDAEIRIEFTGDLAGKAIVPPLSEHASLVGGSGMVVIVERVQPGYSG